MLTTSFPDDLDIGTALAFEANEAYMPNVLSQGTFGTPIVVPYEWASANIATEEYIMATDTFIKGSPAVTNQNVTPKILVKYNNYPAIAGRVEAAIYYHRRANTAVKSNAGVMHVSNVIRGYNAWVKDITTRINISLLTNYKDLTLLQGGTRGLGSFAFEIDAEPLDATSYSKCYSFFAGQIDAMVDELNVLPSRIQLFIGTEAVRAMNSSMIDNTGVTVWDKLKSTILMEIKVEVLPSTYYKNECMFVALDKAFIITIGTSLTELGKEKDAGGNHQYVVYAEAVIPSMLVTDNRGCKHKGSLMSAPTRSVNRSVSPSAVNTPSKKKNEIIEL